MHITHVVRGCEYLTSTPKYNLLYEAFGWEKPTYVHLPLIMGKNEDGSVSKLSKRHGSTSFQGLLDEGYLAPVITNYIALLGWCPEGQSGDLYARGARKGVLDRRHQQVAGRFRLRQAAVVQRRIHPQHGRGDVPRKRDAAVPRGVR